jgi:endonuclease/exonuclease/phosphatase family metal-dependent hydrolase
VRFLMERLIAYPVEGGAVSGISEFGFPEPPTPEAFVAMGDFNMLAGSPEYNAVAGTPDHEFGTPLVARHGVDAALLAGGDLSPTCVNMEDPADESRWKRIDYCFVHASLAAQVRGTRVDAQAAGSDHRPLWVELG